MTTHRYKVNMLNVCDRNTSDTSLTIGLDCSKVNSTHYSMVIYFHSITYEQPNKQIYLQALQELLKSISNKMLNLLHFETRPPITASNTRENVQHSCLITLKTNEENLNQLCEELRNNKYVYGINLINNQKQQVWYPQHISDLDKCQHLLLKFQPELQTDHPGFHDKVYRERREKIAHIAFNYKHGDPIPEIEYTKEEIETWGLVFIKMKDIHATRACKEYIDGFQLLEKYCNYTSESIPQLQSVSEFMHRTSGFRIRPVAGLVTPRDFLASLAFRVFQSTQYIRHHSRPMHTPEPDCIHELIGHVPMLVNREFADFSQELGLASLGASDEEITRLSTLYWFTVEFGLCQENGETRALGAGIMSSFGELENAFSDQSIKQPLSIENAAVQLYDDVGYQQTYFVAESVESMKRELRRYINSFKKSTWTIYDPITETVHMKSRHSIRYDIVQHIKDEVDQLEILINPSVSIEHRE
ncbi:Tyrosine 3-monooxygenase [Schistosoma japonicum]|nr:Tyrosine 3-monooxygenase [Schistosoma japonicum]KAH8863381.1 Tyrosine 3-monooxygenase [Schistosoma japonicum]